jgi:hypothetical protein
MHGFGPQERTTAEDHSRGPQERTTGEDHRRGPQERTTGEDHRRGPQERTTGEDQRRGPQERTTGEDHRRGPQERTTGEDHRRGPQTKKPLPTGKGLIRVNCQYCKLSSKMTQNLFRLLVLKINRPLSHMKSRHARIHPFHFPATAFLLARAKQAFLSKKVKPESVGAIIQRFGCKDNKHARRSLCQSVAKLFSVPCILYALTDQRLQQKRFLCFSTC